MILADARHLPFASGTVQTCVTSPPYFGLRDYKVKPLVWDGDPACQHDWQTERVDTEIGRGNWAQGVNGRGEEQPGGVGAKREPIRAVAECGTCSRCGAWLGSLGLEPTPELFVSHLVQVFREVRRVLRDDGTLWCNLGDSYANDGKWGGHTGGKHVKALHCSPIGRNKRYTGLKPKDLIGIPWMAAFALRADGWYLRSDVIWSKPSPMPESVTDRPTKSHEYVFLLTKSQRYFYDAAAIRGPYAETTIRQALDGYTGEGLKDYDAAGVQNPSDVKRRIIASVRKSGNRERKHRSEHGGIEGDSRHQAYGIPWESDGSGRNCRTVWSITTQPFSGAHFATMPEKLVERCVLAGSRPGDLILDSFLGSGTVARVAISLGRRAIGCDLQRDYLALQRERMAVTRGLPLEFAEEPEEVA